jgi:hypothetical protein
VTVPPVPLSSALSQSGLIEGLTVDGPETTEDTEETRLSSSVASDDEQMPSRLDVERERFDEDVAVGGNDRDLVEDDLVVRMDNLPSSLQNYHPHSSVSTSTQDISVTHLERSPPYQQN